MDSTTNNAFALGRPARRLPRPLGFVAAGLICLVSGLEAQAEIAVTTLGGGPLASSGPAYGYADGKTLEQAQFHTPVACAADSLGYLFVADRDNGRVRRLDLQGDRTKTYLAGLSMPVDVAVDATNNLYVLSQGSGTLGIYDSYGYPVSTQALFTAPAALALDGKGNVYVAEQGGALKKTAYTGGPAAVVLTGLSQPQGLAFLPNGTLAVSEAGSSSVTIWDLATKSLVQKVGGAAGFQDGPVSVAQFNSPQRMACAANGSLLIADQGNHRVRILSAAGRVSTLYGLDPADWGYDHLDGFMGWWDGDSEVAEARSPSGVAINASGVIYTTETYYHIIRSVTGSGLGGGGSGGGTNEVAVLAPTISPTSGYYPMGRMITVYDENSSVTLERAVYYTTDGTEPTTNSARVYLTNNVGQIPWRENARTLESLRVRTYLGTVASEVVSGTRPTINQIGVHRDIFAGAGATVIIPVSVSLNSASSLKSLQFRIELAPKTAATPAFGTNFAPQEVLTSPYFTTAGAATTSDGSSYNWSSYDLGSARGIAFAYITTNADFAVDSHAVVGLFKATVPLAATEGDRYRLSVLQVSGTSDGLEKKVPLTPLDPVDLIVTNLAYRVGDTAPGAWYNAGDFGDSAGGSLSNSDVNNAYNAAFGVRVPFSYTDLYDALDAFPLDTSVAAGGDGQIRYLDWQIIWNRSLGLDESSWSAPWRRWSPTGRIALLNDDGSGASTRKNRLALASLDWKRQVRVQAQPVGYAKAGATVDVPFAVAVQPGSRVAGMQFRVAVVNSAGAPPVAQAPEYIPASGYPSPSQNAIAGNDLLCAWSLTPSPAFATPLQGTNLIGYIRLAIPANANGGSRYTLRFSYVDAAPDFSTQYECESCPGAVAVGVAAPAAENVSDEWKAFYFGGYSAANAADDADPDGDGFTNREEYLAGLNPLSADWRCHWQGDGILLRWFGEAGVAYQVESSADLRQWAAAGGQWRGTGALLEFTGASGGGQVRFYRIRSVP